MERCFGCMQLKAQSPVCEHCGYDQQMPNAPHQLPAGALLQGRYLIGKALGQGGFGITYLAFDQMLEIPVAIKEYYPTGLVTRDSSLTMDVTCCEPGSGSVFQNNRDRFLREARLLAKFSDVPEIVHIQNMFLANGTAYIVMEYVQGIDLRRYIQLRGGRLGAEETFAILRPVMEALSKVHEAGLVHRDISPDNIMMLSKGGAKLLDFGAAREVSHADAEKALTRSTEAILKHGFAPIEQYQRRGSLGPWTDVYALCASIYYCLTGSVPPDAPERITEGYDVDWSAVPGLTARQREALERGMALRAKDRTASVAELYQELFERPVTVAQPQPAAPAEPAKPAGSYTIPLRGIPEEEPAQEKKVPKREKKSGGRLLPMGILAVCVLLGAALLWKPGAKADTPVLTTPQTETAVLSEEERRYQEAAALAEEGQHAKAGIAFAKLGDYQDAAQRSTEEWNLAADRKTIAKGSTYPNYRYILGVKTDGTVVATGPNKYGQCDVADWQDIIAVYSSGYESYGLRSDGTVARAGQNPGSDATKAVESWTDIVSLSVVNTECVIGLKRDGSVVWTIVGEEDLNKFEGYTSCYDFEDWTDIVKLYSSNGNGMCAALKSDGTVVFAGLVPNYLLEAVESWTDIVDIRKSSWGYSGITANNEVVVATDRESDALAEMATWTDVVAISGYVALKSDGTAVAPADLTYDINGHGSWPEEVSGWTDVVALYGGEWSNASVYGLRSDGTVVAAGPNENGARNVDGWMDIVDIIPGWPATIGLRSNGTVVIAEYIDSEAESWTDILVPQRPGKTAQKQTVQPTEAERSDDGEIYANAVAAYEAGDYAQAQELFTSVSGYAESEAYLRLIRIRNAGGNDSVGKYYDASLGLTDSEKADIDAAEKNFDFADTAQVLLCNSDVAFYFLLDNWTTDPGAPVEGYIDFKTDAAGGYRYNRKPTVSEATDNDMTIEDGILYLDAHGSKWKAFRFTMLTADSMELYSYETGRTFTMYRRDYSFTK